MSFPLLETLSVFMFFVSLFGVITCNNVVKSIIFTLMLQSAVIMFWLSLGRGKLPPIIDDIAILENTQYIADPLPQALMLTAIIIGISVTAVIITMLNTLYRKHKMTDWKTMEKSEDDSFKEDIYGSHLNH